MKKVLGISLVIMLVATFVVPVQTLAYSVVQEALGASGVYPYAQGYYNNYPSNYQNNYQSNYQGNYPTNYQNNYQGNYQGNYQNNYQGGYYNNYPSNYQNNGYYYGYGQGNLIVPQYQNAYPSQAYYPGQTYYASSWTCSMGYYTAACGGYYGY